MDPESEHAEEVNSFNLVKTQLRKGEPYYLQPSSRLTLCRHPIHSAALLTLIYESQYMSPEERGWILEPIKRFVNDMNPSRPDLPLKVVNFIRSLAGPGSADMMHSREESFFSISINSGSAPENWTFLPGDIVTFIYAPTERHIGLVIHCPKIITSRVENHIIVASLDCLSGEDGCLGFTTSSKPNTEVGLNHVAII